MLTSAAEHFNRNPKEGYVINLSASRSTYVCSIRFEFLKTNKMLPDPIDPRSVAIFLKNTPRLDKSLVGAFLGKRDEFNLAVTKEYHIFRI